MNSIQDIISVLNKNEQKSLYNFITRSNDNSLRVQIYNYIKKHKDDQEIISLLKIKPAIYRRLKNDLLEDVCKAISVMYYNYNKLYEGIHHYIVARILKDKGLPTLSNRFFQKAEKNISNTETHLLYLLYTDWIELLSEKFTKDPRELIKKREKIFEQIYAQSKIDSETAELVYLMKISQNLSTNKNLVNKLEKTLKSIKKNITANQPNLRLKFYESISRVLQQKKEYTSLEKFTSQTIQDFEKNQWFDKYNYEAKIKMIINLINCNFYLNRLENALKLTFQLQQELFKNKKIINLQYYFFYYNSLVLIYSKTNKKKAIETLHEALKDKVFYQQSSNVFYAFLNLSIQYFDLKDYKSASTYINKTIIHENFKLIDEIFQYKILVLELIIRYHREDFDYCETLLRKLHRMQRKKYNVEAIASDSIICQFISHLILGKKVDKYIALQQIKFNKSNSNTESLIDYEEWLSSLKV